jgi:hypothetical protein
MGFALPALAFTDSPSPPGWPGSPELTPFAPFEPLSPSTVTTSARAPTALAIMTASDGTPAINARAKVER